MPKKILITGGAGFIGSNLTDRLLREGYFVHSIDNFITSTPSAVAEFKRHRGYIFQEGDIVRGLGKFADIAFDEIYHLACPTGVDNLLRLGEEMVMTSTVGTKNVLESAKKFGSRMVFTSSSEVYGDPEVSPQSEEYCGNVSSVGERSPYEEGKRMAESLVALYVRKFGVHAVVARVFNTYGPRMNLQDSRVIPKFVSSILKKESLPIHGNGNQTRTFCYVDDLVEGLVLLARSGSAGGVYNVGSCEQVSILRLAQKMRKIYGNGVKFKNVLRPAHDHRSRMPDTTKIAKLGWDVHVQLDEGLRRILWNTL